MTWVRIDDEFFHHPKPSGLGALRLPAIGLHVLALCWCNKNLTNGKLSELQVGILAGDLETLLPSGRVGELVDALVSARMWRRSKAGYVIHDYLKYQPSRKQVLDERKATAARVRKHRNAKGNGVTNGDGNGVSTPVPNPPRTRTRTRTRSTIPKPELSVRPSTKDRTLSTPSDPTVATDGRTDEQGRKNRLAPSGQRLARWVDRYVPRIAAGNGYVGVEPTGGGTFVGAERLIRRYGARRVLSAIRGMSEERYLALREGDGHYLCWQRDINSPAEYLAWYLRDDD